MTRLLLFLILVGGTARAQWSTDPMLNTLVCPDTTGQTGPVLIADDNAGGAIICWDDFRENGTTYVQRLDQSGNRLWGNGVKVDTTTDRGPWAMLSDGSGGAYVVWYKTDASQITVDLYVQRVGSGGQLMFAPGGLPVAVADNSQFKPQIVLSSTGIIVAWYDGRANSTGQIYVQRILPSGAPAWATNGIPVVGSSGAFSNLDYFSMASDGNGGAIITWIDWNGSSPTHNVYAQRIDANGAQVWPTGGVRICTAFSQQPVAAMDAHHGAIIAWQDVFRSGRSVYAQRVDSAGTLRWDTTGVLIGRATSSQQKPLIVDDGFGGAIVTWNGSTSAPGGQHISAQRVDAQGSLQWTSNIDTISHGVALCPNPNLPTGGNGPLIQQETYRIAKDGQGGAVVSFTDFTESTGRFFDVYAQRINSSGQLLWSTHGAAVSTATDIQAIPVLASDDNGNTILAWDDYRNNNGSRHDTYSQRVNGNGTLGGPTSVAADNHSPQEFQLLQNYPNPFNPTTNIKFQIPQSDMVSLKVFNVLGQQVATLMNEELKAGSYTATFDANNVASGIYFYKLQAGNFIETKRMLLIK